MSEEKLLTKEEEIECGYWIQRYLAERSKRSCNSHTRKRGTESREKLIISNLKLVQKIAHNYKNSGLDVEDLISEGNIGLIKAVEKFDPNHGSRFSTYATYWIRQAITRALSNQSRTIRLPSHAVEKYSKIIKFINQFKTSNDIEPTVEEIHDATGVPEKTIKVLCRSGVTNINSLDSDIDEENDLTLQEVIPDETFSQPDLNTENKENMIKLEGFINSLSRKEKHILIHRFGLNNKDAKTLDNLANKYGLSRERIRQIQLIALNKLQSSVEKHYREVPSWKLNKNQLKCTPKKT
tara:strand:+ start:822 stop:1706 length:885 start_codon:yes stop_codon:yes gene_type:complete